MSGTIQIIQGLVSTHKSAIAGHAPSFNVTFPPVSGGTAPAISDASAQGVNASTIAGRYAAVLPRSAGHIQTIATLMSQVDSDLRITTT